MTSTLKILLITFLSMFYVVVFSQNYNITIEKFGLEEGLSQSAVNCILQDKSGILWIGTQDGLNKFDGYNFTILRHEPFDGNTLSSNYILDIEEDKNGNLLLATQLGFCIFYKNKGIFKTFYHNPDSVKSLSGNVVYNILVDSEYRIWLLTDNGFYEFIEDKNTFNRHKFFNDSSTFLSNYNNLDITEDSHKRIWVGTKDGLNYFDRYSERFKRYSHNSVDNNTISNNEIRVIYEDKNEDIWIGTQNGLNKLDLNSNTFERYFYDGQSTDIDENIICSVFENLQGDLWIGTRNGLKILDKKNNKIVDFEYFEINNIEERISDIISDFSDILWVAGWDGIYKIDTRTKKFNYYYAEKSGNGDNADNYIYSIFVDNEDNIWSGSKGVNFIYRGENNKIREIDILSSLNVYTFLEKENNNVWIGTNSGLFIYNKELNKCVQFNEIYYFTNKNPFFNNRISTIKTDNEKNIWIGTFNGLYMLNENELKEFHKSENKSKGLISNEIYSLLIDKNDNIWIGTVEGLNKFDKKTGNFECFTSSSTEGEGLTNNSILSLYEDNEGIIWIGTESGLNKFNPENKTFDYFTCKKTGFKNDYIYAILEDNSNNLWLSTNNGIVKFNKNDYSIVNYGIKDGNQDYEFNLGSCYKTEKGELFFGGVNGINSFFPDSIKINTITPKTIITRFLKSNLTGENDIYFETATTVELAYHDNFTIYFTVPEYSNPKENLFQYKCEGITDEWTLPSNRNFASFSQLKPGDYIFYVKGANSDGIWNEEPAIIKIHISPPVYFSNLAYFTYVLLFLIIILLIFLYVTRNIRKENQILTEKNKASEEIERQRKELETKNTNITDSIHYAKIIIDAMLPSENMLKKLIPNSFILFIPKDIVSGDFYWFLERKDKIFIAAVDCTGHGVPGAFMSIVGIDMFRNIINKEIYDPATILNKMNEEVALVFEPQENDKTLRDGMDLSFCVIDKKTNILSFAGAYNPLYLIRDNSLVEFKANRFSVGLISKNENLSFTNTEYQLQEEDVIYLFSDGYTDQFGGVDAKKFKFRRFRHLLLSIHQLPMNIQKDRLIEAYNEWRNGFEQVDDILIIGIKPFTNNDYKENYF